MIPGGLGEPADLPPAPDTLDEDGAREWDRAVALMVERGTFNDGIAATLEAYCASVATVQRCRRRLQKDGDFIESDRGPRKHPAHQIITATVVEMRRMAAELGLTRGASGPLGPGAPAPQDDLFSKLGIV